MQAKERIRCCPSFNARSIVKNGYRLRDFVGLPIGGKRVTIRMKVQRYKCKECNFDQQEKISFATNSCSYTHRFAKYVVDLLRGMTLQDMSNHLGVSWNTVKEIHSSYLKRHYSLPSLDGVENIGIDEFAVRKGHVYKTIVVDLDRGRIIYISDGKGSEALKKFWRKVKHKNIKIKHVATDLSAAFIASVMENCSDAVHVFDHFHVVKLMNEKLDNIRRKVYSMEKDINKRKVLKGTRYLLLGNGADIFDKQHKSRLENALAMNEPLSKAYYLKEQLHQIWSQPMKAIAEKVLDDWIRQAEQSKIAQLQKMAVAMRTYKKGILAWYDCHLSTGKVEGINNKIKVMKRNAYGFRDKKDFTLRLYVLHNCRITRNVG